MVCHRDIISGCNVENACYGLGICAEVCAVSKAVSLGETSIVEVAVAAPSPKNQFTSPCGRCRQFLCEFASSMDIKVHMIRCGDGKIHTSTLRELLPMAFTPKILKDATAE